MFAEEGISIGDFKMRMKEGGCLGELSKGSES
jgi:hypothetical protein